jgi:hypothetical protein
MMSRSVGRSVSSVVELVGADGGGEGLPVAAGETEDRAGAVLGVADEHEPRLVGEVVGDLDAVAAVAAVGAFAPGGAVRVKHR